ncbi:hypothetical protein ABZP36_033718 [Zizania latifolia]
MAAPSSLASSHHLSGRATVASPAPPHRQHIRCGRWATPGRLCRCRWAGRAAPRRRATGVCFVVSPSKPDILRRWDRLKRHIQDIHRHSELKGFGFRKPNGSIYTLPMPDYMS